MGEVLEYLRQSEQLAGHETWKKVCGSVDSGVQQVRMRWQIPHLVFFFLSMGGGLFRY